MMNTTPEIVIIGGGIGGGALATVLARQHIDVVVLERETDYPDRVRGEFIVPWGCPNSNDLGCSICSTSTVQATPNATFPTMRIGRPRRPNNTRSI